MAHCIISRMLVYAGCVALQRSRYVIVSQMVVQKGCGALLSVARVPCPKVSEVLGVHVTVCPFGAVALVFTLLSAMAGVALLVHRRTELRFGS